MSRAPFRSAWRAVTGCLPVLFQHLEERWCTVIIEYEIVGRTNEPTNEKNRRRMLITWGSEQSGRWAGRLWENEKEARGKWPKSACYFSKMSNFPVYGNRRGRPADGSLSGKQSSSFEMRGTAICPHTHAPLRRPLIPLCHWLMNCVTWGQPGNLFEMELSINVDKYLTRLAWVLSAIWPVKASSIVFGTQ